MAAAGKGWGVGLCWLSWRPKGFRTDASSALILDTVQSDLRPGKLFIASY